MLVIGSLQTLILSTIQTNVTDKLEENKFLIFIHLNALKQVISRNCTISHSLLQKYSEKKQLP